MTGAPSREALTATLLETVLAAIQQLPRVQAFPRPVSIVFGAEDRTLNTSAANSFHEHFPDSTLQLIMGGAGHNVQLDAHERVIEAILKAAGR
ncbi:MAG: hypothetical protein OXU20_12840 [Myxococcales bacterium]|nr:hypothetical protein [Myxococcales bacterium]